MEDTNRDRIGDEANERDFGLPRATDDDRADTAYAERAGVFRHNVTRNHFIAFPHMGQLALVPIHAMVTEKHLAENFTKLEPET